MLRGTEVDRWAGEGFNAYARAALRHTATHVCEACVFVCSRLSPVPGRDAKEGKKMGGNFRNYSHAAVSLPDSQVHYVNASKAETSTLVTFLRESSSAGDWAMAIAVSGQKHVIPHAPMNRAGSSTVQIAFEDLVVRVGQSSLLALVSKANELRGKSGCSASAIATGEYHPKDLQRARVAIAKFEAEHGRRSRGGGVLELAAFLTSKAGGS